MSIIESIGHLFTEGMALYQRGKAMDVFGNNSLEENLAQNNKATGFAAINIAEEFMSGRIDGAQAIGETAGQLLGNRTVNILEEKGWNPVMANLAGWAVSYVGGKVVGGIAEGIIGKTERTDSAERTLEANGRLPNSAEAARQDPGLLAKIQELLGGGGHDVGAPYAGMNPAARGSQAVG